MEKFDLIHIDGKLFAVIIVDGVTHRKDVTSYFENPNSHDDWLDYRIAKKYNDARFL